MSRRRKKKKSTAGLIVLLLMFVILALLLALRAFSLVGTGSPDPTPVPTPEPTLYEEVTESGLIIRQVQTPEPEAASSTDNTPEPTPTEEYHGVVVLEDHGELEIIVPDDMDSDGF